MPLKEEKYLRLGTSDLSTAWNRAFHSPSGWRMADGGKSVALPNGRSVWIWGDTFATDDAGRSHFVLGSTIAVSPNQPPQPPERPPVQFFARMQTTKHQCPPPDVTYHPPAPAALVDISSGLGVRDLIDPPGRPFVGAWDFTGCEGEPSPERWQNRVWLWLTCGLNLNNSLYLISGSRRCTEGTENVEPCQFETSEFDGQQWISFFTGTNLAVSNWAHFGRYLLTRVSHITWWWMYDDRADSGFVYIFGLGPSNTGTLYVARALPEDLLTYSAWRFLHWPVPGTPGENWTEGDDPSTLMPLATHVGQEFSIDKLTINGVTRWLLVHARWSTRELEATPEYQGLLQFTGIGILRVSRDGTFTSFPDHDEDFFWTCVKDVDPDFNRSLPEATAVDPEFAAAFRGFSLHSDLSALVRDPLPFVPGERRPFPVLLGYTLFPWVVDENPDDDIPPFVPVWARVDCATTGDGQHCGARRFAEIDLADIWPEPIVWEPVGPRPPPIVGQPIVPRPPIFREPIIPGPYPPRPEIIGILPPNLPGQNLIRNPVATAGLHGLGASSAPYASAGLGSLSTQYTSARPGSSLADLATAGMGRSVREASAGPGTPGASASFGLDAPASLTTAGLATAVSSFAAAPVPNSVPSGPQPAAQSVPSRVANAGLGSIPSQYAAAGLGSAQQSITTNAFAARPTSSVPNAAAAEPSPAGVSPYDAAALTGLGDIAAQKATAGLDAAVSSGATGRFAARSVDAPLAPSVESAYGRAGGTK